MSEVLVNPTPPQRDPQSRNIAGRDANFSAYQTYERQNLPGGQQLSDQTQAREQEFFRPDRYDPAMPHQMDDAAFSERGRLLEVSGPYVDQMLEKYTGRVAEVETNRVERKYGGGIFGRMRRWFGETQIGARVNYALKTTLGALCHAGSIAAPMFAPALSYAGNRLMADGILQAGQFEIWERPIMGRLQNLRLSRHLWVREMQNIRNGLTTSASGSNEYDRYNVGDSPPAIIPGLTAAEMNSLNEAAGPGSTVANEFITIPNLNRRLEIVIQQLDNIEIQIQRNEEQLARIRTIGKRIRTGVGIGISGLTAAQMFTHGLSMGVQDFDKIGGSHEVLMTGSGVKFAYHAGEQMANGLIAHGGELHTLGALAPWGQIGASAGALAVGALGSTLRDFRTTQSQGEQWEREGARLPEDQAVFSFRGRTAHGDASGVNTEIEDTFDLSTQRQREVLNERKRQMSVGSVWRMDQRFLDPSVAVPGNASRTSTGEILIQIVRWEGQQGLSFAFVTPDAASNLDANNMIIDNRYAVVRADAIIQNAHKESDDILSTLPEARVDKFLESKTEDLSANPQRSIKNNITLSGGRVLPRGHFLEIIRPSTNKGQIIINEYSDASTRVGGAITITPALLNTDFATILDNTEIIADRAEAAVARLDKFLTDKGVDIKSEPHRLVKNPITIAGRALPIPAGRFIQMDKSATDPGQINVRVYSDATARVAAEDVVITLANITTDFNEIIDNSEKVKSRQEGVEKREKEANAVLARDINRILGLHYPNNPKALAKGQVFSLGDPSTSDEWLAVAEVDDTVPGGRINVLVGGDRAAIVAAVPKDRKVLTDQAVASAQNIEHNFTQFRDYLNERPTAGTGFDHRLIQQTFKI